MKIGQLLVAAVILVACTSAAFGQLEDTGEAPPWSKRFAHCSHPKLMRFDCPYDPWRNVASAEAVLRGQIASGEFKQLEQALGALANSTDKYPDRRLKSAAVFRFMQEITETQGGNAALLAQREQRLAEWRAAIPESGFVVLARGFALYDDAWSARGQGYASSVSKESWRLFHERLRAAEDLLLAAPERVRQTPTWHELLLDIALNDSAGLKSDWHDVFARAANLWPGDTRIYLSVVSRLQPKWGGSWAEFDAFADSAAKNTEATEGRSFYARMYSGLGTSVPADQVAARWPKLKAAFFDWLALSPDEYTKNRYASYACYARDKAAFKDAIAHLRPEEFVDAAWLDAFGHDSCVAWAQK